MTEVTGLTELSSYLRTLSPDTFDIAKVEVGASVLRVQNTITGNFISGGGFGGDKLHARTGLLRRSMKTTLEGTNFSDLKGSVHTDVVYAPIQETGGTISAKRAYATLPGGPYLNIPLAANLTAAGVMRQNARDVFAAGGFIIKSKVGNYIVMSGVGQPMFVLKRSVKIPARLGMENAMNDEIPTLLGNLDTAIQSRLEE